MVWKWQTTCLFIVHTPRSIGLKISAGMYIAFTPRNFLLASQSVTKKIFTVGEFSKSPFTQIRTKTCPDPPYISTKRGRKQASFEQQTVLQSATEFARFV